MTAASVQGHGPLRCAHGGEGVTILYTCGMAFWATLPKPEVGGFMQYSIESRIGCMRAFPAQVFSGQVCDTCAVHRYCTSAPGKVAVRSVRAASGAHLRATMPENSSRLQWRSRGSRPKMQKCEGMNDSISVRCKSLVAHTAKKLALKSCQRCSQRCRRKGRT